MAKDDDPAVIRRPATSKVGIAIPAELRAGELRPAGTAWPGETTLRDFAGLGEGERVALAVAAGSWTLLRKIGGNENPPPAGAVFAGSLLRVPVPDVLSLANAMGLEGELTFSLRDATKRVHLRGGSIVFASSSLVDDRLGEQLLAQGRISRRSFDDASDECIREKKKFGKVLVERGLLTSHDLYAAVHDQIEAIVLSLFNYPEGSFAFVAQPVTVPNPIRLANSISHYVLEGVRRSDELKPALEEVSDRLSVFKPSGKTALAIADGRPGVERDVATLIDGISPVWEILARTTWSEANTLLALARLLRAGLIRRVRSEDAIPGARPANALDAASAGSLVETVNGFLRDVHRSLAVNGGNPESLGGFFDAIKPLQRGLFAGLSFESDGSLDLRKMISNFASLTESPTDAANLFREGLQDVVEFALWVASDQVSEAEAWRLSTAARALREGKT